MLESSARRPAAAAFAFAATALVLAGCSEEKQAAPTAPSPTPVASLSTSALQIPRLEFCQLVPGKSVTEALGGKADSEAAYGNGDEEAIAGVGTDVVHELGCSWTGNDATARAWVFARPVSPSFAQTVVATGAKTKGCRPVTGPSYGEPSALQVCTFPDGVTRVRYSGLFGQTWLTCELAASATDASQLRSRTDQWCVEVANALNTAR